MNKTVSARNASRASGGSKLQSEVPERSVQPKESSSAKRIIDQVMKNFPVSDLTQDTGYNKVLLQQLQQIVLRSSSGVTGRITAS